MKFPEFPASTGVGTTGATGVAILVGVIWNQLSPRWLVAAVLLIISGIGQENRKQ